MTRRVEIAGDRVLKRLAGPDAVARLVARTGALRAAGVATPEARATDQSDVVAFPRIQGESGLTMLIDRGEVALAPLVAAAAVLHGADAPKLQRLDPLTRIRPRLADGAPSWIERWIRCHLPPARGGGPVHGDLHAGQLIRDRRGRVWLLDLDDLAAGPPEADLGNFAAHLATRPETRRGEPLMGLTYWLTQVLVHAPGADPGIAARYGRIALLRRALKLAEQGERALLEALSNA